MAEYCFKEDWIDLIGHPDYVIYCKYPYNIIDKRTDEYINIGVDEDGDKFVILNNKPFKLINLIRNHNKYVCNSLSRTIKTYV